MIRQTLNRLLTAIPTLGAVLIASFLLMRFAPGGPFDGERPLDDATRAALEASYGLDQPIWQQLITWLGRVLMGDFGPSLVYRDFTVTELVAQGLPTSMMLGGAAIILAFVVGLALGVRAALAPGGYLDKYLMLLATLLTALPVFVTGPLLVLLFAVTLRLLPLGGTGSIWHWVLPVIALSLPVAGAIAKLVRAALADLWQRDAIRTARARGLSRMAILYGHALRPALVPVVSYLGPATAGMLTGAVVVETVFGLPGLGRYFVQGALNRDYPLIMAVVLIYALLIILFNLIADLLYAWLDPRVQR
jgi:oligopeptide transport system permease protein